MTVLSIFFSEVRNFSSENSWVYAVYAFLLLVIAYFDVGNLPSILTVTLLHFCADILIMMMYGEYSRGDYKKGTYFQIASALIYTSIKLYTGIFHCQWLYLYADIAYWLAAYKNYQKSVKKHDVRFINLGTMSTLSVTIIVVAFWGDGVLDSPAKWITTIGLFLFAIALSSTSSEKQRYLLSIPALSAMSGGSAMLLLDTFSNGDVVGLALSYTLMPLTVLFFYLKQWNSIMRPVAADTLTND